MAIILGHIAVAAIPATAAPKTARSELVSAAAQIELVGLETGYGYDGFGNVRYEFTWVLLLKSGDAVRDSEAITTPGGLAAHRRANPDSWTKWRKVGRSVEMLTNGRWKAFDRVSGPPPRQLAGSFSRTSTSVGAGTAAQLSATMVFDGKRFASARSAGSITAGHGGGGVTTSGRSGSQGTYSIDGYVITLRHDDGQVAESTVFTHPTDHDIVWIGGQTYTRDHDD